MRTTLNVFQRLARQWDAVHPYNAAQILKLQGVPNRDALQDAWHDALNDLGLGRVKMDGDAFHYECLNGEMALYGVRVVPPGMSLEDYISQELNRPFSNPAEPPFRPFVLAQEGHYYAGVIYHHWVADSVSIRTVLREWFVRLFDPSKASKEPVKLPERGYRSYMGLAGSAGAMGSGLLTATRWASNMRRARRVEGRGQVNGSPDLSVRIAIRSVPSGWLEPVHAAARARGVTLNDVFMAAIAQVCDQHVPLKMRPRRQSVALGAIVDLRPYSEEQSDTFGLLLGFTNVVCRPHELRDRDRLIRAIALQNVQQKKRGIPQASALRMLAGVAVGRFMGTEKIVGFYQKHVPMAGGISNVNLNRCWATEYHPAPLLDYIRISPTGPMMPLVFATTTLGKSFHFALTYRPSVIGPATVDRLGDTFIQFLSDLAKAPTDGQPVFVAGVSPEASAAGTAAPQ